MRTQGDDGCKPKTTQPLYLRNVVGVTKQKEIFTWLAFFYRGSTTCSYAFQKDFAQIRCVLVSMNVYSLIKQKRVAVNFLQFNIVQNC